MTPKAWMDSHVPPLTHSALAREWSIQPTSVWRPATGREEPSYRIIVLFFQKSGGKVGLADWIKLRPPGNMTKGKKVKK